MLVDSHCHLDFPGFRRASSMPWSRARAAAGIGAHGHDLDARRDATPHVLAIAERFADVYCSVGTHPHHAHEEPDVTAADLVARTRHPKVVAIGEAGLDYHYDNSAARRAGAGLPHPHRGGARDRAAAGHPFARGRRRHGAHPRGGNGEGRLPGRAALLHRRARPRAARGRARALRSPSPAS